MSYNDLIDGNLIQTYNWQFGDGSTATGQDVSVSIVAPGATPIILNMTAANGCTYQVAGEIFVSTSPVASFTYTFDPNTFLVTFDNTSTIGAGSIVAANWDFGDNSSSTEIDPSHTFASAGLYTVSLTVTSAAGCTSDFSQQVNASVGVEETALNTSWIVYPNPAMNRVQVVSAQQGILSVMDATGKILLNGISLMPYSAHSIDTSAWAEGMYQMVVQSNAGTKATRLMKVN